MKINICGYLISSVECSCILENAGLHRIENTVHFYLYINIISGSQLLFPFFLFLICFHNYHQGWTITDKEESPQKWTLPAVEMDPGDYILIVASGEIDLQPIFKHVLKL